MLLSLEVTWGHLTHLHGDGEFRTYRRTYLFGNQAGHHNKGPWTVIVRKMDQILGAYMLHQRFNHKLPQELLDRDTSHQVSSSDFSLMICVILR